MLEEEKKLLQSIAASRGISVEALLAEQDVPAQFAQPIEPAATDSSGSDDPVVLFVKRSPSEPEMPPPLPPEAEEVESGSNPEFKPDAEPTHTHSFGFCRQCGWDQRVPPVAEPTRAEIMDFLYVSLGQKVYSKEYSRFGGRIKLRLRTLYVRELEALYEAAYKAQKVGIVNTPTEYYDYINRMRLYLQVSRVAITTSENQIIHNLPDVLNKTFGSSTGQDWIEKLKTDTKYNEKVPLMQQVQSYMMDNILVTETLQRMVIDTCATFNRLVAMLESRIKDENFWNEMEMPM